MSNLRSFNANLLFLPNGSNRYCIIMNFPSILGRIGFTMFFGKTDFCATCNVPILGLIYILSGYG